MPASVKPWTIASDTFGVLRVWDAEGTMIGGIHEDEWDDETVSEHARLIAAAPDLLAACERAKGFVDSWGKQLGDWDVVDQNTINAINAALKKARG